MFRYCRVFVDSAVLALDRPFDYSIPDRTAGRVAVGQVVRVPLHGRRIRGFVVELLEEAAVADPRPLSALVSAEPLFGPQEIELARWVADRYVTSLGVVLHDAVPGRYSAPTAAKAPSPTAVRAPSWLPSGALDAPSVVCEVPSVADEPGLLAAAVAETAERGQRSLIVCPRVAVAERIARAIEGAVLLHGDQRPAERSAAWAGAREGSVHVVVGGRASLLVPLPDLGLVAVASAHDRSLRSERTPRLNALVVARRRAEVSGARFLASSPAPPLDLLGDGATSVAPTRRARVRVEVVRPRGGPVTPRVIDVIEWGAKERTDVLVFAGRLGGVLRLRCADCGWYPRCPECGTGLPGEPDDEGLLRCRVCPAFSSAPEECPACGGAPAGRGWGHTRIASALERLELGPPVVSFVRGDAPVVPDEPAIVVGTIAAVHGWPRPFGAICVADLDQLLARADFRAAEHALQTLHELAGALREGGRFLVQTREPEHHVVQAFTRRSFSYFAERELPLRKEAGYPPYGEIALVEAGEPDLEKLTPTLRAAGAMVLGPIEGRRGLAKILVRVPSVTPLLEPLRAFAIAHPRSRVDIDPVDVI